MSEPLERARKFLMTLPGVERRMSWGFPQYRVGKKMFAATGVRFGGPHLALRIADVSEIEGDDRWRPIGEFGSWKGYLDWYFYFFVEGRRDDWKTLERVLTVSWELYLAMLPKKTQDAILAAPVKKARATPQPTKRATKRAAKKAPKK